MKLSYAIAIALALACIGLAQANVPEEREAFKDYIRELHKRSAAGDFSARDEIRRLRIEGYGYQDDYVNVYELMDLAEHRDDPEMHFAVASALYHGKGGFDADHEKARKGYEVAASAGHRSARFNLGLMLMEGEGGEADLDEAFECFARAQRRGHRQALAEMGIVRFKEKRYEESVALLEAAPSDGDVWNDMFLGDAYLQLGPSPENRKGALRSYKRASDRGLLNAHFKAAAMLLEPEAQLEMGPDEALKLLNRALDSEVGWAWNKFRDDYLHRGESQTDSSPGKRLNRRATDGPVPRGRAVMEQARLPQDYSMKSSLRSVLEECDDVESLNHLLERVNARAAEEIRNSAPAARLSIDSQ